jgi:transcriptional regulator with XRE-family HTH domain
VVVRQTGADADLARVIRALRADKGFTQEAVAHGAGLTVGSYARIERGESNPSWITVTRIVDALGVSLGELGEAVDKQRRV